MFFLELLPVTKLYYYYCIHHVKISLVIDYTPVSVVVRHKFLILSLFHSLLSGIFIAPI